MARRARPQLPRVDERVHGGDCMCPSCLCAELDGVLLANGLDPADYPVYIPRGKRWSVVRPESSALMLAAEAELAARPPAPEPAEDDGDAGPVHLPVSVMGAGVWATFTGVDHENGCPVTVTGVIVAGPDPVDGDRLAVLVRDYRQPDVLLLTPADATAEFFDLEDADDDVIRAHVLAPVYAPGAERVQAMRVTRSAEQGRRPGLAFETHRDLTAVQLDELERTPGVLLTAVHRPHLPIGDLS